MIRNNLAKLLIDRNIRATELSEKTGIARSTLSRISNNTSSKIDFDTLDEICVALEIKPHDFFTYIPFQFDYKMEIGKEFYYDGQMIIDDQLPESNEDYNAYEETYYEVDVYLIKKKNSNIIKTYKFIGELQISEDNDETIYYGVRVKLPEGQKDDFISNLPIEFKTDLKTNLSKEVYFTLVKKFGITDDGKHFISSEITF